MITCDCTVVAVNPERELSGTSKKGRAYSFKILEFVALTKDHKGSNLVLAVERLLDPKNEDDLKVKPPKAGETLNLVVEQVKRDGAATRVRCARW